MQATEVVLTSAVVCAAHEEFTDTSLTLGVKNVQLVHDWLDLNADHFTPLLEQSFAAVVQRDNSAATAHDICTAASSLQKTLGIFLHSLVDLTKDEHNLTDHQLALWGILLNKRRLEGITAP